MTARVLIALRRIGPYHHARLAATNCVTSNGKALEITALETRPLSQEYAWSYIPQANYQVEKLAESSNPEADPPNRSLDSQIGTLLDRQRPQVIVTVGWADRSYQRLILAAHSRRLPLIIVSDSRITDEPRIAVKEAIKRLLLRNYSSALVAGKESRAYLEILGFPSKAIYQPWDVVDNDFFAQVSTMANQSDESNLVTEETDKNRIGQHFLCVSRFITKKNLPLLLESYAAYQRQGGSWGLRLMGGGPLESMLRHQSNQLPAPERVKVTRFEQLEEIRRSYRAASALVLASTSDQWGLVVNEAMASGLPVLVSQACGCRADLVDHGVSGWCFEPNDREGLTALLHQVEHQNPIERAAMVQAARNRLKQFSPASFAAGLAMAVQWAHQHPRYSRSGAFVANALTCAGA